LTVKRRLELDHLGVQQVYRSILEGEFERLIELAVRLRDLGLGRINIRWGLWPAPEG
jgi:hypothetical protein